MIGLSFPHVSRKIALIFFPEILETLINDKKIIL